MHLWSSRACNCAWNRNEGIHLCSTAYNSSNLSGPCQALGMALFLREEERDRRVKFLLAGEIARAG